MDDRQAILQAVLRRDLAGFIERCFIALEPGTAYRDNWHIHAIAYQLMRVARGECTRLIVNVPPRSAKSICCTIAFIAWFLGHDPRKRVMAISYADRLSHKHAADFRSVVTSAWYRSTFPQFQITSDRRDELVTTENGYRMAGSIGGAVLGRGADLIVIDDPINGLDAALSEAKRQQVTKFFDTALYTRLNDRSKGAIVIVMQRLHEDDLVGHVLGKEAWDVLSLPAIAPEDALYRLGDREDAIHQRRAGDVLHPERETREHLEIIKRNLGTMNFSAQYQQNPLPAEGNVIKREWLKFYDDEPEAFERVVVSWDTASTLRDRSDYSAGTVWGAIGQTYYLREVIRGRWETPDLRRMIVDVSKTYDADSTLIEATELGRAIAQDLRRSGELYVVSQRPRFDKTARLLAQAARFEAGQVFLPREAEWLATYLQEILAFPGGKDDQVDSTSQALKYLTAHTPVVRERRQPERRPGCIRPAAFR
jgi:predicted phage terminase large subunit-like protein